MQQSSQAQSSAKQRATAELTEGGNVLHQIAATLVPDIVTAAEDMIDVLRAGGKLFICGNHKPRLTADE